MNASAPALPREQDLESKILKIRTFARDARTLCAALFWFVLFAAIASPLFFFMGSRPAAPDDGRGIYEVLTSPLTPLQLKAGAMLGVAVGVAVWLAALYQLYRLFGSLAAGAIYTAENVRRVRYVGLLWLLAAVFGLLFPLALVVANGFIGAQRPIDLDMVFPSFGEVLGSFASAGLVLLVSWIMDVGRYEKEHADALRRDADLVI